MENRSEDFWKILSNGQTVASDYLSGYVWSSHALNVLTNAVENIQEDFEKQGITLTAGSLRQGLEYILCGLTDSEPYSDWARF